MKRIHWICSLAAAGFMLLGATAARADDCALLGGNIVGTECQITGAAPGVPPNNRSGTFNLVETLHITGTGIITVPPVAGGNNLTINITGGLTMDAGAQIIGSAVGASAIGADITITTTGDVLLAGGAPGAVITSSQIVSSQGGSCSGGSSGNITLTSTVGNITTQGGSVIAAGQRVLPGNTTTKCPAGEIIITTGGAGKVDIDGSVLSQSQMSGVGAHQPKGGGPITIKAGCSMLISGTGVVSSQGMDPGADLVHIEGCTVEILGLVESTGSGHVLPEAGNRCNASPATHPIGTRSSFFDACVEVWSGTTVSIVNGGAGNNGEINANTGLSGGPNGRGWIDVFARGDISITGNATYAVHSNAFVGNDDGGLITVKSSLGRVLTAASAIQANSTSSGSRGGDVIVEASQNIEFGTASIEARGASSGGSPGGGHITAQSYHGAINGTTPGELDAFGGNPANGTVMLTACTPPASYLGTVTGARTNTTFCAAAGVNPVIPANVPSGSCQEVCGLTCRLTVIKSLVPSNDPGKFNLLINGTQFATDVGDQGTTGPQVCTPGANPFGESAGTNTNLGDYSTSVTGAGCSDLGGGQGSITLALGDNKICTIVNSRKSAKLELTKSLSPQGDPGTFDLTIKDGSSVTVASALGVGNGGTTGAGGTTLGPGTYTLNEAGASGTLLGNYTSTLVCVNRVGQTPFTVNPNNGTSGTVVLANGDDVICTITNTRNPAKLELIKQLVPFNDPGTFNLTISNSVPATVASATGVGDGGTTGAGGTTLPPGTYGLAEAGNGGTNLGDFTSTLACVNRGDQSPVTVGSNTGTTGSVVLLSNANVVCTITNTRKTGTLRVNKVLVPPGDPGRFNLQIDGSSPNPGSNNVGDGGTTGAVTVNTGIHGFGETGGTIPVTNLADYTTTWTCSDETAGSGASGSVNVTSGSAIVCTITNTRKTGTLTVNKVLIPSSDPGRFNLQIDGSSPNVGSNNVGDGGTTGAVTVNAGVHGFGETGGTVPVTSLADYTTTWSCNDQTSGSGASSSVNVPGGSAIVCTITNTRKPRLTVNKVLVPANDPGLFNLQIDGATAGTGANVGNGGTTGAQVVTIGAHSAGETAGNGTNLADYTTTIGGDCAANGAVTVAAGDNKVCTITNTRKPRLTVNKVLVPANDPGLFNLQIDGATAGTGANVGNGGTTGAQVVTIGAHTAGETAGNGTNLTKYTSVIGGDCAANGAVTLAAGDNKVCTITNTRTPDTTLQVIKTLVPSNDAGKFNLQIDGATAGTGANVGNGGTTGVQVVTPGAHTAGETAGTATSLGDYISVIGGDCAANGSVTLAVGENKVCTITNTRRPKLTVVKTLVPSNDPGKFNLQIDGSTVGTGANVGNGGTTGAQFETIGAHTAGETAGTSTSLTDYNSVIGGDCAANGSVTLAAGDNKVCTITNTRKAIVLPPPELVVIKQLVPTDDPGKFNLQIDGVTRAANVGNGGTTGTVIVTEGTHHVGETAGTGTTLSDYVPGIGGDCAPDGSVTLVNGDHKVCIISNAQSRGGESGNPPNLVVIKILVPPADPGKFNLQINGITRGTGANVGNLGTTGSVPVTQGTHIVGETAGTGSDLANYLSVIGGDCAANGSVTVVNGDTKVCTITNTLRVSITPFAAPPPPTDIPALDSRLLAALGILLAVGGAWALRRRESVAKTPRN